MATYAEIQQKIQELQAQAEQQRSKEIGAAVEQIKSLMLEYGITENDLFGKGKGKGAKAGKPARTALYRDSQGNEWSGRGRQPNWLQGKNKEDFLIG